MKLKIYARGTNIPIETHYIKEDEIYEPDSKKFIKFTTVNDKSIITNMDFIITDQDDEK